MSQDIINNRFLEESVFAIADGYCVINLSTTQKKVLPHRGFLLPAQQTVRQGTGSCREAENRRATAE